MSYIVIGSTAVKYWYDKYITPDNDLLVHDLDITSLDTPREQLFNLGYDVVMNDGYEYNMALNVCSNLTEKVDDHYIMTPEALAMYYLSRPRLSDLHYPRYLKDVMRLRTLRYILIAKGSYKDVLRKFRSNGYNDFHLLFYVNKYFYRLSPWINSDAVIANDWAILAYMELLLNTHHRLRNLDFEVYNVKGGFNPFGSKVVSLGNNSEWNEVSGFKLEHISSLINKESNPKVIKRLNRIQKLYPYYK